MSTRNLQHIAAGFAISFWLIACSAPPLPSASTSFDQMAFSAALKAKGFKVETTGGIEQPFLRVKGIGLRVNGGNLKEPMELQAFNYADAKSASDDANQIEPSGSPRTMQINWIAPPHFFRKERVLVIYVGSDANALGLLTELLGAPFAGK